LLNGVVTKRRAEELSFHARTEYALAGRIASSATGIVMTVYTIEVAS